MTTSKLLRSHALALAAVTMLGAAAHATHLKVDDVALDKTQLPERLTLQLSVGWDNAWHNERNHDAAWIFVQLRGREEWNRTRARILAVDGLEGSPAVQSEIPANGPGVWVFPPQTHRGSVQWRLELELDPAPIRDRDPSHLEGDAFALEMVEIPQGSFALGDPDPASLEFGAFYRSNSSGQPDGVIRIEAEDRPIVVGARTGHLDYRVERPIYQGDRQGPIPAAFPKGFERFYIMKYEITQGQYATFLNNLSGAATFFRAPFAGRGYYDNRGSIRFDGQRYLADHPNRPANYISWDDGAAFADWAGLRPMTELEYTKASRGPGQPRPHEFPWGTSSHDRMARVVMPDDDLVTSGVADERRLSDETRDVFGASYYWVLDLAGSVWERVVTVGHPAGRAFEGTHGDGRLTTYGYATNEDWPKGDDNGGGYGYRGGGHYEHGRPVADFNPWSPIAYRTYGAWGAAPRSIAYGFRGVRSAPR